MAIECVFVAASCHLSLPTCNRSVFVRGLSIDSCAYFISQHMRWPIRAPLPTCANQDAWVVITPKRPKANSVHTAAWHNWPLTLARKIVQKAVFSLIHFPASFIRRWSSCHFDLGGSRHGWGLLIGKTDSFTALDASLRNISLNYSLTSDCQAVYPINRFLHSTGCEFEQYFLKLFPCKWLPSYSI